MRIPGYDSTWSHLHACSLTGLVLGVATTVVIARVDKKRLSSPLERERERERERHGFVFNQCQSCDIYLFLTMYYRNIVVALWIIVQGLGTIFNAGIAFLPISLLTSFFLYVGLMVLLTVLFILLNRKYKYRATP